MNLKTLDQELQKIFSTPGIILIYGPAGSGKSLLCLLSIKLKKDPIGKIIYVDVQSSNFQYSRFKQICSPYLIKDIKDNIFFIHPKNFDDQSRIISHISELQEKIAIIIIDNITYLYRLEKGGYGKSYKISKKLIEQVELISAISKNLNIPIIVSSHVYSTFKENQLRDFMVVGGKILESKSTYKILLSNSGNKKRAIIINSKDNSKAEYFFQITQSGIEDVQ